MTTMSTTKNTRIKIVMTQTITTSYFLTEEQLEELGLPTTVAELSECDTDELGVVLLDDATEHDYAITEREIEITSEPEDSTDTLPGE